MTEVEAIVNLIEEAGLEIVVNTNVRLRGATKIFRMQAPYGEILQFDNPFHIVKENDIWLAFLPTQLHGVIFKMDKSASVVASSAVHLFELIKDCKNDDYTSVRNALAWLIYSFFVIDIDDKKRICVKKKLANKTIKKTDIAEYLIQNFSVFESQWSITIELVEDGWLVYSETLDKLDKPIKTNTLNDAVQLITTEIV